jgi:tetratricopeptide (TPR) repeat protein
MKVIATLVGLLLLTNSGLKAQDCTATPPYEMNELAAFSIFQDNYKNKDYPFALMYGRWLLCSKTKELEGYPRFSLASQYPKFIDIYTQIGLGEQDPSIREAYIDTALSLFEEQFTLFTDEEVDKYELYQDRGRYLLENYQNIDGGLNMAYGDFKAMFDMDVEKTTLLGEGYYVRVVIDDLVRKGEKDMVISMIDQATAYAGLELSTYFDDTLESLFNTPEERLEFCGAKLEENPESIEDLKCVAEAQEDLNMTVEFLQTTLLIHELEPTFDSALTLAETEKGNSSYTSAAEYFKQALEMADNDTDKKNINLELADVYSSTGELSTSKRYVQDALAIDDAFGRAYIKLASVYGQAVSSCTESRKLEARDKVVYWVVVDYLTRAKSVDASVTNTVNSQLATYEAVTPSTEDKFFTLGYEQGQRVQVNSSLDSCYSWINESTVVR